MVQESSLFIFIYFWLRDFSPVAVSRGFSLLCLGFLGSRARRLSGWSSVVCPNNSVALQHVGSSQTRDGTFVFSTDVKWSEVAQSCLTATTWTVAHQAPPSMGFSRQEYWSGLPFPSPGAIPDPGIEPRSPALPADSLPLGQQGSPLTTEERKK